MRMFLNMKGSRKFDMEKIFEFEKNGIGNLIWKEIFEFERNKKLMREKIFKFIRKEKLKIWYGKIFLNSKKV